MLSYTGARQVDIVGHSLGVTLAREWMRQDHAWHLVRALVAIDGPNHGMIDCSPNPLNYFNQAAFGGFTPESAICQEYGSGATPLLSVLNRRHRGAPADPLSGADGTRARISSTSPRRTGSSGRVPAEDSSGQPHDFGQRAPLRGAATGVELTGQGQ